MLLISTGFPVLSTTTARNSASWLSSTLGSLREASHHLAQELHQLQLRNLYSFSALSNPKHLSLNNNGRVNNLPKKCAVESPFFAQLALYVHDSAVPLETVALCRGTESEAPPRSRRPAQLHCGNLSLKHNKNVQHFVNERKQMSNSKNCWNLSLHGHRNVSRPPSI